MYYKYLIKILVNLYFYLFNKYNILILDSFAFNIIKIKKKKKKKKKKKDNR